MNFFESFKQAFDSLRANKLRSVLTMIGIIMGVFSIITIMAIGNAAESYMTAQFDKLGANVIDISNKNFSGGQREALTMDDIDVIKKAVPEIKNISTVVQKFGTIRIDKKTRDAVVYAVASQYENFMITELLEGRFINDIDVSGRTNTIVVDESFARKYFKRTDIIGETVSFSGGFGSTITLKIVGVLEAQGGIFAGMMDSDMYPTFVYMPITTAQTFFFNDKQLSSISVSVEKKDKLKEIGERIIEVLERKHGKEDIFMATNTIDQQNMLSDVLGVVSSVLLVIALITLIVGGIGIINILLVSVTERIREIGIRKALGARKRDIVIQFITESIIMTGISGLIGILIGVILGIIISSVVNIPPVVDFKVITLAFLGSISLGLIFGVYPAKKAADLDPIESLRYE